MLTRRQKGPKGPNPLSVKKKKQQIVGNPKSTAKARDVKPDGERSLPNRMGGKRVHEDEEEQDDFPAGLDKGLVDGEPTTAGAMQGRRRKRRRKDAVADPQA